MEQQVKEDSNLELLTIRDVCEKLQVSRWTVNGLIRSGQLESVKIGSGRRIPLRALEKYERRLEEKEGR